LVISSCLFLDGVSGVPRCILHIAGGVMRGSLGLIKLAFGFHVLVTTELTGTFFDGAFGLVRSALYVFAIVSSAIFCASMTSPATKVSLGKKHNPASLLPRESI
jgi:hypothetical protein